MTHPTPQQVDAAVRAVLAELGRGARRAVHRPDVEPFAGRLLSLRNVEEMPAGTREVRIAPGTVITPLAHDLLKRRGIGVRLVAEGPLRRGEDAGEWGFAIEGDSGMAAAVRRVLLEETQSWREIGADVIEAARWVAECRGRGAAVFTPEASVATWRACQVGGVRAASASEAVAVARAVRHLGANLLVIEPAGQSLYSLRHLCATFRRSGAPAPPDWLTGGPSDHEDRRGHRPGDALAGPPEPAQRPLPHRPADAPGGARGGLARAR
jgi:hypothetical protein